MKRTRLKAVSDRRRKRDAGYQKAREAAMHREAGWCQVASADCVGDGQQIHHRAGRGGPNPHRLDNLVVVCLPCHNLIHSYPEWARARGWMQSRIGGDAA